MPKCLCVHLSMKPTRLTMETECKIDVNALRTQKMHSQELLRNQCRHGTNAKKSTTFKPTLIKKAILIIQILLIFLILHVLVCIYVMSLPRLKPHLKNCQKSVSMQYFLNTRVFCGEKLHQKGWNIKCRLLRSVDVRYGFVNNHYSNNFRRFYCMSVTPS